MTRPARSTATQMRRKALFFMELRIGQETQRDELATCEALPSWAFRPKSHAEGGSRRVKIALGGLDFA